jgi:hypothetical protein
MLYLSIYIPHTPAILTSSSSSSSYFIYPGGIEHSTNYTLIDHSNILPSSSSLSSIINNHGLEIIAILHISSRHNRFIEVGEDLENSIHRPAVILTIGNECAAARARSLSRADGAGHEVTAVLEAFVSPVGDLHSGLVVEATELGAGWVGGGMGLGEANSTGGLDIELLATGDEDILLL